MSDTVTNRLELQASDGARCSAYHAKAAAPARAGLVVVQEIFGLNSHIRAVADGFAAQGYDVLAPALFDRLERGVELGYDPASMAKGRSYLPRLGLDKPLLDLAAAVQALSRSHRKVGIVGYCWGGSLAFLAAAELTGLSAAVGYYGSVIARHADRRPRVPVLLHFGEQDASIPPHDVAAIRQERPEVEVEVYPAGHGFNCDQRASYDLASATRALSRTLAFFERHLAR